METLSALTFRIVTLPSRINCQ